MLDMYNIDIRPAVAPDTQTIVRLLNRLADDTGLAGKVSSEPEDITAALSQSAPFLHGIIAEIDRDVGGLCLFHPVYSSWRGEAGIYILDLMVNGNARNMGMGRLLLRESVRIAQEKWQARFIKLEVDADNHAAEAFYEKLGLRQAGRDRIMMMPLGNSSLA